MPPSPSHPGLMPSAHRTKIRLSTLINQYKGTHTHTVRRTDYFPFCDWWWVLIQQSLEVRVTKPRSQQHFRMCGSNDEEGDGRCSRRCQQSVHQVRALTRIWFLPYREWNNRWLQSLMWWGSGVCFCLQFVIAGNLTGAEKFHNHIVQPITAHNNKSHKYIVHRFHSVQQPKHQPIR